MHINTEIRVAYRDALKKTLMEENNEIAPYKLLKPSMNRVEEVVSQKLKLFSRLS